MHKSLIHKLKISTFINSRLISGGSLIFRRFSTENVISTNGDDISERVDKDTNTNSTLEKKEKKMDKASLYKMILATKSSKNVGGVLEGKSFYKADLVACVKELRKNRHYHYCLEILEWLEKSTKNFSERDYALRLGIIRNLKGIDEAEKYFDTLPPAMKNHCTYGALLALYCAETITDKALALFKKMDDLNYLSNVMTFNSLIGLYIKLREPEKVPPLVLEMKKRNIQLNTDSYCMCIQSYGYLNDLEGLQRVVDEFQVSNGLKKDWTIYSNLAAAYAKVGQSEKAEAALKQLEELLDTSNYTIYDAYHKLISLGAVVGNLELVTRVWNKFKLKSNAVNNFSYLTMLKALSKLDHFEGLKMCFKEWELICRSYDSRLPTLVIGAYLKQGMVEEAEMLLKDAIGRSRAKLWDAHGSLADYYLGKRQIDSALRHINSKGTLLRERINPFFEYFREERDVDGAEYFCRILKKVQALDSRAYLGLLQTYAAAEKTAPGIRQRMEKDGIKIGTEHVEFLEKVNPK